jgi:hypothetical protein
MTVWALTLATAHGSVAFALGTADDTGGAPAYQPDSVAVISDPDRASRYWPVAATSAAFGQTIWQTPADEPTA